MENGIDEALINETRHIATKIVGYMYLRKDVENFHLVRAPMYYSGTKALQSIPPTDDAFVNMFFVQFSKHKFGSNRLYLFHNL